MRLNCCGTRGEGGEHALTLGQGGHQAAADQGEQTSQVWGKEPGQEKVKYLLSDDLVSFI